MEEKEPPDEDVELDLRLEDPVDEDDDEPEHQAISLSFSRRRGNLKGYPRRLAADHLSFT